MRKDRLRGISKVPQSDDRHVLYPLCQVETEHGMLNIKVSFLPNKLFKPPPIFYPTGRPEAPNEIQTVK
jgi:hypothetical protein